MRAGKTTTARVALIAWAGAVACGGEPAAPAPLPAEAEAALDLALDGPVTGRIAGEDFTALDVRARIVTMEGRERVDLFFADRPIERCGLPMAREQALVWLRFAGRSSLEPGTLERLAEPAEDAFEVHYERPEEDGLRTAHRGVARVEIARAEPARIEGRLRVCFADADRSCVGGTFTARPCYSRIDGRLAREPPGLVDEALEPREERPRRTPEPEGAP